MGAENVLSQLKEARPGIKYTSPAHAGIAALRQLNARRIALLSPYELALHRLLPPFLSGNGFEITADGTFATSSGTENNELRPEIIFTAAKELVRHNSPDALFMSCTAMPIVAYIDALEREIGIPVISSTQAMAWDALRLSGYDLPIDGFGRLLASPRR
nr:aspartate/glutamate racemase family protein [Bradyrhizobium sp. 168]